MTLSSGRAMWVCFCTAQFLLCTCFPFSCSDDTRFTGICFGAGGVMSGVMSVFTHRPKALSGSRVCSYLVWDILFSGVMLRETTCLCLHAQTRCTVNTEGFDRYGRSTLPLIWRNQRLQNPSQIASFTHMTMIFHHWFRAVAELVSWVWIPSQITFFRLHHELSLTWTIIAAVHR